ncbi:protein kinase domain-containing protein [Sorangium sp. So ce1153]|uniref:serine/threonine-protein kinase n=1 Tax=Sorangium sp. So ce1153 TaxID=3133333 RepID=UPI003F636148
MFNGKYRVLRLLGQGGMGSVYEVELVETGELLALKCVEGELLNRSKNSVSRFQREVRAMGALDTEHIVRVRDAGTDPATGAPFMVMELLEGEDLQRLLDRVGKLEPDTALRIAAQVCVGLQKAHEARILHRDIKPANLFLARRGEGEIVVKILDFGIAKIKPEPHQSGPTTGLTRTGGIIGSPLYMSPEQARGLSDIDYHTDLWSLGVVLYRALSGRVPHEHIGAFGDLIMAICSVSPEPIQELAPWVGPEVAAVVHGALKFDAGDRFPSAAAMLDAIRPLLPHGSSLREEHLVPVSEATCAVIAPKHPMSLPPDDAHRRMITRIAVRVGRAASEPATIKDAPGALREAATGSTTLLQATVTMGTGDATARSNGRSAPRSRARPRRMAAAAVGLTTAAGVIAFSLSRAANQQDSASPSEAAAASVPAMAPAPVTLPESTAPVVAAPPPALQRARLAVSPADVSVEIDGAPAKVDGGEVAIEGAPGSRHRVRLFKGKDELRDEVILTEAGAAPPRMQLDTAKPRPAAPPIGRATGAPKATAVSAPPSATSTAGSLIPDTFR